MGHEFSLGTGRRPGFSMLKIVTFLVLVAFAWWRFQRYLWHRRLRREGEEIPEQRGPRAISLLAGVMLAVYGGYMLWHLFGTVSSGT
jgi:hypothetical protein